MPWVCRSRQITHMLLTVTFAVVQSGQRAVKQYVCISFAGLLFVSRTSHLRLQPLPQPSCSAVLLRASKGFICISAASVGVVHPDSMGASQSSLEKPQESESAAAAVAATAAPPHAHQQQASPSTSASAKHATSSSAAADAAVHSKPHVPWSKRLAKAAVWAIRVVLVVEGAALAKAVLVRSLGGSSGSTTSSEEPSDAVDKLVDYLAGRRGEEGGQALGSGREPLGLQTWLRQWLGHTQLGDGVVTPDSASCHVPAGRHNKTQYVPHPAPVCCTQ